MESPSLELPSGSVTCVPQHLLQEQPSTTPHEQSRLWEEVLDLYDVENAE